MPEAVFDRVRRVSRWLIVGTAAVIGAIGLTSVASAQSTPVAAAYDASHTIKTNVPGIETFAAPPAGYDAVNAADEQNATFGLPPRPNQQTDPAGYAKWKQAVGAKRVNNPLRDMGISSANLRPANAARAGIAASGDTQAYSLNWSGIASVNKTLTKWSSTKSFYLVYSDFNIPTAQQAFNGSGGNICDGGIDYEVSWNGIDGFDNGDVLQGGSLSAAQCISNTTTTSYCGWVEWYPSYSIECVLSVNPGDDMFVETWDTSSTQGYVYVADLTSQTSASYSLTPTEPPYLVGNSAEYIVERPCCSSGSTDFPLANYVQNFWGGMNWAYTFQNYALSPPKPTYPGTVTVNNNVITMLNNAETEVISAPETSGPTAIFFQDGNCAQTNGC